MLNPMSQVPQVVTPILGRVGDVFSTTRATIPVEQEGVFLPEASPGVVLRNFVGRASVAAAALPGVALAGGDGVAAGYPFELAVILITLVGTTAAFVSIPGSDHYGLKERNLQEAKNYDKWAQADNPYPVLGDAPFVAECQMHRSLEMLDTLRYVQQPLTFSARVYLAYHPGKSAAKMQTEAKTLQAQVESKMLAFWQEFAAVEPQALTAPEQKLEWLNKGLSLIKLLSRDAKKSKNVLPLALSKDIRRFKDQVYKPTLQMWLGAFLGDAATSLNDPQDITAYLAQSKWLADFCNPEILGFFMESFHAALDGALQTEAKQLLNERTRLANKRCKLLAEQILVEINPLVEPAEIEACLAKHESFLVELNVGAHARRAPQKVGKDFRQEGPVERLVRIVQDFRAEQKLFGARRLEDYILD